jgi:hypothetical protein
VSVERDGSELELDPPSSDCPQVGPLTIRLPGSTCWLDDGWIATQGLGDTLILERVR